MGYCSKCGNKLEDNAKFCPSCGNNINNNIEQFKNRVYAEEKAKIDAKKQVIIDIIKETSQGGINTLVKYKNNEHFPWVLSAFVNTFILFFAVILKNGYKDVMRSGIVPFIIAFIIFVSVSYIIRYIIKAFRFNYKSSFPWISGWLIETILCLIVLAASGDAHSGFTLDMIGIVCIFCIIFVFVTLLLVIKAYRIN